MREHPHVIGLSGYAQSGKDTTAVILEELYGYKRVAFADTLREALYRLNPWITGSVRYADLIDSEGYEQTKKLPEVRRLLQVMGTEVGRQLLGDNVWVSATLRNMPHDQKVVITDMRFPNEYTAIMDLGGVAWRINRPGIEAINAHPSETALDGYHFDAEIFNGSDIRALADKVMHVMDGVQAVYQ